MSKLMADRKTPGRPPVKLNELLNLLQNSDTGLTKEELAIELFGDTASAWKVGVLIARGRQVLKDNGKTITAIPFDRPGQSPGYRYKIELAIDEAILGLRRRTKQAYGLANGYANHTEIMANSFPELQGLILGRLMGVSDVLTKELSEINGKVIRALRAGSVEELAAVDPEIRELIAKEEEYYVKLDSR